ncbi:unnamed protein product [Thelazia callipaeda]|uniref:Serine-rich coiled-coil domain-containing protein 2 n=1 Tax=Thelazia callipaeda TaxID=103827 RepID=A0A0N5D5L6_THECL|nr:unnamed protein product [Thelazia callipaeda]
MSTGPPRETKKLMERSERKTFVFGSSTPRDLSYMRHMPATLRTYDCKVKPTSRPKTDTISHYMRQARSVTRTQSGSREGSGDRFTRTSFAFGSSTPRLLSQMYAITNHNYSDSKINPKVGRRSHTTPSLPITRSKTMPAPVKVGEKRITKVITRKEGQENIDNKKSDSPQINKQRGSSGNLTVEKSEAKNEKTPKNETTDKKSAKESNTKNEALHKPKTLELTEFSNRKAILKSSTEEDEAKLFPISVAIADTIPQVAENDDMIKIAQVEIAPGGDTIQKITEEGNTREEIERESESHDASNFGNEYSAEEKNELKEVKGMQSEDKNSSVMTEVQNFASSNTDCTFAVKSSVISPVHEELKISKLSQSCIENGSLSDDKNNVVKDSSQVMKDSEGSIKFVKNEEVNLELNEQGSTKSVSKSLQYLTENNYTAANQTDELNEQHQRVNNYRYKYYEDSEMSQQDSNEMHQLENETDECKQRNDRNEKSTK